MILKTPDLCLSWRFKSRTAAGNNDFEYSYTTMDSPRKTSAAHYQGTQHLPSLLNPREWSPTSLFERPEALDKEAFPEKPQPDYLNLIQRLSEKSHPELKFLWSELHRQKGNLHAERSRACALEYSTAVAPLKEVQFSPIGRSRDILERNVSQLL